MLARALRAMAPVERTNILEIRAAMLTFILMATGIFTTTWYTAPSLAGL